MEHSEETFAGKNCIKLPMNAAQFFMQCLENEGVRYIFGILGEENIHMIDTLNKSSIRFILTRHEQAASFMADIYVSLVNQECASRRLDREQSILYLARLIPIQIVCHSSQSAHR
jgi:hypothetical protein